MATAADQQHTTPADKVAPMSPAVRAHTVEDLHVRTAEEILREGGTRKEASMRHFTVNFG